MKKGQKIKTILINSITFLILLVGTIAILDELSIIRDDINFFLICFAIVFSVVFVW